MASRPFAQIYLEAGRGLTSTSNGLSSLRKRRKVIYGTGRAREGAPR